MHTGIGLWPFGLDHKDTRKAQRWRQVYFEPSITEPATATGYSLGYSAGNGGSVMNLGSIFVEACDADISQYLQFQAEVMLDCETSCWGCFLKFFG